MRQWTTEKRTLKDISKNAYDNHFSAHLDKKNINDDADDNIKFGQRMPPGGNFWCLKLLKNYSSCNLSDSCHSATNADPTSNSVWVTMLTQRICGGVHGSGANDSLIFFIRDIMTNGQELLESRINQ